MTSKGVDVRMRAWLVPLACLLLATAWAQDEASSREQAVARAHGLLDEVGALLDRGDYAAARVRAREAVALAEEKLGPKDAVLSECLGWLGASLEALGDFRGAKTAYERALGIDEEVSGPESMETASSLNNLGNALRALGDLEGAKPLYERSLAIREAVLGAEDERLATALNNLGSLLWQMGDGEAARPRMERALALMEKSLGKDHPHVAVLLSNLAQIALQASRLQDAKALFERALSIREKSLGPEHPETAGSLRDLGWVLLDLGDLVGARDALDRALARQEKSLGPEHVEVAAMLINLAYVERSEGAFARARVMFERALAIRRKALGPDHPDTAIAMGTLATALEDLGELTAARPLIERALAVHERALGPGHVTTAQTVLRLARLAQAMGDHREAQTGFRRALSIFEKELGPDHPVTAASLNDLAALYHAMGDLTAARSALERSLEIQERLPDKDDLAISGMLANLAVVVASLGDGARAEELCERAIDIQEKAQGPDHPGLASVVTQLALLKGEAGDRGAELALLGRALRIREAALGPRHPHTAASLATLAISMRAAGDAEGARPLFERAWRIDLDVLEAVLPSLSSRERREALRQREQQLGRYLFGVSDSARTTWSAALAWKGAALRASAGSLRLPADASEEARRTAKDLSATRRRLASLAVSSPVPRPGEPSIERQYDALRRRVEELERSLSALIPGLGGLVFRSADAGEAQAAIPEGAAFLDILQNDRHVYAWVVRRNGEPSFHRLGKAVDLEPMARQFRDALERDDEKAWKEAGTQLRAWLEKPLAAALEDAKTLYVSPDGVLATIPWGLLPDGEGFLVERLPIVCTNGGASLALAARTKREEGVQGLLALGDVDYGGLGRVFPALSQTKGEVEQVADRFHAKFAETPCRTVLGTDASETAFRDAAPKARYVHVATHGFFDIENMRVAVASGTRGLSGKAAAPIEAARTEGLDVGGWNPLLLSGLVLAASKDGDGYLTAEELQDLDLRGVELVVLSACETGRGELAAGEGVLGLSRALAIAGARQFMLSLWKVPDEETSDLMDAFYAGLWDDSLPAEEALRRAQLAMLARDRERGVFRPSTWGAWVLTR